MLQSLGIKRNAKAYLWIEHINADGIFLGLDNTRQQNTTLCGLEAVESGESDKRNGTCIRCFDIWCQAHWRFGIRPGTFCKGKRK